MKWESTGGLSNNQVLQGEGFFISYVRSGGMSAISMFDSDDGSEETALCISPETGERTRYLILNGDYRQQYEDALPNGLDACMAVYEQNVGSNRSSWSEPPLTDTGTQAKTDSTVE